MTRIFGPWDDSAALANEYGFADVAELANGAIAAEAQRAAEDAQPLPVRTGDRIEHLLGRVARGTYTPGAMFAGRDEAGRWAAPRRPAARTVTTSAGAPPAITMQHASKSPEGRRPPVTRKLWKPGTVS